MKRIKIWMFAMMLAFVMPVRLAAGEGTSDTCTCSQMDDIVAKEVQRQVNIIVKDSLEQWADSKIIDLKIAKVANEKLDKLQGKHDDTISHELTMIGVLFTILATIIGIFVPLILNNSSLKKAGEAVKLAQKSANDAKMSAYDAQKGADEVEKASRKGLEELARVKEDAEKSKNDADRLFHKNINEIRYERDKAIENERYEKERLKQEYEEQMRRYEERLRRYEELTPMYEEQMRRYEELKLSYEEILHRQEQKEEERNYRNKKYEDQLKNMEEEIYRTRKMKEEELYELDKRNRENENRMHEIITSLQDKIMQLESALSKSENNNKDK